MASTFPTTIDIIPQFLDITQADASLLDAFQVAMRAGDFATANLTLEQIASYGQKIVTAERLNQLRDALLALETFWTTTIEPYLLSKQVIWQAYVDQFDYKDTWSSSTSYLKNNIVKYTYEGFDRLYLAKINNSNKVPTNTIYWLDITFRGAKGDNGQDGTSFSFEWLPDTNYLPNTIISYGTSWYIALQENVNVTPQEGAIWDLILSFPQPIYPMQADQPSGQQSGEIWFQLLT